MEVKRTVSRLILDPFGSPKVLGDDFVFNTIQGVASILEEERIIESSKMQVVDKFKSIYFFNPMHACLQCKFWPSLEIDQN